MDITDNDKAIAKSSMLERIELVLPSTLESVCRIEQAAEDLARRAAFDEEERGDIALVVREAAINACKHGNRFSGDKKIGVDLGRTAEGLVLRIADQGDGLDPEDFPDVADPANLLRPSGRGVFLMRSIMDEVRFRQLAPGTEVTLIKRRR